MADLSTFKAHEVEPAVGFEPLPAGKYVAAIVESETKTTKAGTGQYLELKFQILEGEYKGRHVWARLNLWNPNQLAVDIARGELSAIYHAVGLIQVQDSSELHDLPMLITVKCRKREDGEVTNEIRGYARQETTAAVVSLNGASTPPWKRG